MKAESVTLSVQDMATLLRDAVRTKLGCDVALISVVTQWPADSIPGQTVTILTISKGLAAYGAPRFVSVNVFPNVGPTSHRWEEAS